MANYKWSFANVGGVTRVCIQSAEDVRHLGELDKKMWTVLSCPVNGLEISSDSLSLMDLDGDGQLRLKEVVATAEWLCATLKDPQSLFEKKDSIAIDNISDESLVAVARKIVESLKLKVERISLADVQAAIDAVTIEAQEVPAAPLEADVIAAYKEKSAEYAAYFEQEKLQKLGLASIPEETPKPGMTEKKFIEMGKQIADWEAAKAAAETANADALAAAKAEFEPLRKLLLLHRDFYRLLRNFVTLEDFYDNDEKTVASFQAGTLILDQRACKLCIRVNDLAKHDSQAPLSGMYLLYCNCENKKTGKKLQIVAAMTQGEIKNLSVGKNGIFYDNDGLDYDATVFKIIENPISIRQAFWTPYRKMAKWVEDKINKSAAEKDAKAFDDMTAKADAAANPNAEKKPAFDIAKFAGIFAAIGMALGMIGTALVKVGEGMSGLAWWQYLIIFVCILLVISGPSMIMAWMKLRRRNLAPVLNANGWAVNADSIISVPFGLKLTEQVRFPFTKNPVKKNPAGKICLVILLLIILGLGGYGIYKYITKEEVTAEEVMEVTETEANPAVSMENAETPETVEGTE
ncbi:MAG: phage holin family protein [Bacteroidales bacterium]|nr:phage holin family protein [Bacteroidales bacterium]MDY6406081.1 phage holin family protein [Bacteroidales bacterium]